ncbi:hypothetical protein TNCV_2586211 [Trichonephila clavipes]|nr:hypothetical protein TNCV_2586211 [Trichonephila clavipes]
MKDTNQYAVNPSLQAETVYRIESMRSPMTSYGRSCHNLCNWEVILSIIRDSCSRFARTPQTCCIGERSSDLASNENSHIFEDIIGRAVLYVDEHCLSDKWHLGDLVA